MTDTPPFSGADLARQALAAARANAKNTPAQAPKKPRPTMRVHCGEHADPQGLAGILNRLTTEQGWTDNIDGGNVIDQWSSLCPQYVGLVQPVHYDDTTGRLDLRPATHAYAAQLRILGGQLAKQINDKMGRPIVRTIRVLPVGAVQQPNAYTAVYADRAPDAGPEVPVKTRETASPGYRATLEAALAHKPEQQPTNPYVIEAMCRQEAALRAGRQAETEHRDAQWATDGTQPVGPAPGSVEESLARARAYARQQRASGQMPRRAFDAA
jgi:predicted nucleic acid-binding Zn ribbon protein